MGFYSEVPRFEQTSNATLEPDDVKCSSKNIEEDFPSSNSQKSNHQLETSTNSTSSLFASIRALFSTSTINDPKSAHLSSRSSNVGSSSKYQSSGYESLEESWDIDDTYIKVSKFIENEDSNEVGVFGTYKEYKEQLQQQALASEIKSIIENYQDPTRILKISDFLALRTAGDVLNLSKCEPYGLKGCKLILIINDGDEELSLGSIYPEKGIFSTFEITLVLHLKRNPCRRLPFMRCKQTTMDVLQQYELRKEKKYTAKGRRSSPTYCR